MRVLIVEDEADLRSLIAARLSGMGLAVDQTGSMDEAEAAVRTTRYDAAILDRRLPDGDGLNLLRSIRRRGVTTPVMMLTARDAVEDRVEGLDVGADDYLLKPFDMPELLARTRALLRRPSEALSAVLRVGDLALDTASRRAEVSGNVMPLSRRETALLEALMQRAGRVATRAVLEEALYNNEAEVTGNSIEASASRLRRSLAEAGAGVRLHTVRGVGYFIDAAS